MKEGNKTKEQLIDELVGLRQQIAELRASQTERDKFRSDLRVAKKYAQDIIDSSMDMIIAVDKNRKIIEFNEAAQKRFGYELDDIIGKDIGILYRNPEEGAEINKGVARSGIFTGVVSNICKNGDIFPSFVSASSLYDTEGNFLGVMGISRDITEQKKVEKELEQYRSHLEELVEERSSELKITNDRLRQEIVRRIDAEKALVAEKEGLAVTLRSIGDGVISTDMKGNITLINKVAEKLTGWTEHEAVGKQLDEVFHIIDGKTRERYGNIMGEILTNCEMFGFHNAILISKDETEKFVNKSGSPIHDKGDDVAGVVLVFSDDTKNREIEKELLKIEKLESIGILAGGIAHDFNNLLTGIMGYISLAKTYRKKLKSEIFDILTKAENATFRARDLTQQLLIFSKGGMPVLKPSSIKEILEDSTRFALIGSSVGCKFHIADDLWQAKIDEGQISQVVNNIVINANHAMAEGGMIKISAENVIIKEGEIHPLKDGKYIKIAIQDHGIGISEENKDKIFDPFFTTKETGNGLGLATSYSIIKNHDGYITVESKLGIGTTFHIYLPACPEINETKEIKVQKKLRNGEGKILVMDDEDEVRKLAFSILKSRGYDVITAKDGTEAIELYKEAKESGNPIKAVILDLTVSGGMGGREAIQKLMEIDSEVKAIASSGYSLDPIMSDFRKYGFINALSKPYGVREICDVLSI